MSALLEFIGLGEVTGLDLIFGITALVGTLFFLIWFVLMMLGGVMGGLGEAVFGADIGMDADLSFKALTFQGIAAFRIFFGHLSDMIRAIFFGCFPDIFGYSSDILGMIFGSFPDNIRIVVG